MKFVRAAATAAMGLALAGGPIAATTATAAPVHTDPSQVTAAKVAQPDATCNVTWRHTKNHAGYWAHHSWAWKKIVGYGSTGKRVKEVQCLTRFWSGRPAHVDGIYGSRTKAAVEYTQSHVCHMKKKDVDGIVGPKTWKCLRTYWVA